jgi:hypothetical protein
MKKHFVPILTLVLLLVTNAISAQSMPINLTAVKVWPNERSSDHQPSYAIDGDTLTFTWCTENGNVNPATIAFAFEQLMDVDRLRLIKNTDGTGFPTYTKKNLEILVTTDTGALEMRTWTRVSGLASGFGGTEIFQADSIDPDGFVWGDMQDIEHGWGSLIFNPVASTGVAIHFETPDEYTVYEHYQLFEFRVYGVVASGFSPAMIKELYALTNHPNPFNSSTTISYYVPKAGMVSLTIIDLMGREVCRLVKAPMAEGTHSITWDGQDDKGTDVRSGIYFSMLEIGDFAKIRKIVKLN